MAEKLGQLLETILQINRRPLGRFIVFCECAALEDSFMLTVDTKCQIEFVTNEQDERGEYGVDTEMCDLADITLVQEVVLSAKEQKPDCTQEELVRCLQFYLERDAFYRFKST